MAITFQSVIVMQDTKRRCPSYVFWFTLLLIVACCVLTFLTIETNLAYMVLLSINYTFVERYNSTTTTTLPTTTSIRPTRYSFVPTPFDYWQNMSEPDLKCVTSAGGGIQVIICPHGAAIDVHVSGVLWRNQQWEPHIQTEIHQCLIAATVNDTKPTFLDIGAQLGTHSLFIAKREYKVVALEPSPENLPHLHKAILLNNFTDDFILLPYAISDSRNKTVVMTKNEMHNVGHTFIAEPGSIASNLPKFYVSTILFDDVLPHIDTDRVVVKIDVEGHECVAFRNATTLLSTKQINCILMEWLVNQHGVDANCTVNMIGQLTHFGFKPYPIGVTTTPLDTSNWRTWVGDIVWKKDV